MQYIGYTSDCLYLYNFFVEDKFMKSIVITFSILFTLAACSSAPYQQPYYADAQRAAYEAELMRRQRFYQVLNPYTHEITAQEYKDIYRSYEPLLFELPTTDEY